MVLLFTGLCIDAMAWCTLVEADKTKYILSLNSYTFPAIIWSLTVYFAEYSSHTLTGIPGIFLLFTFCVCCIKCIVVQCCKWKFSLIACCCASVSRTREIKLEEGQCWFARLIYGWCSHFFEPVFVLCTLVALSMTCTVCCWLLSLWWVIYNC